jgi:hypothetical protein
MEESSVGSRGRHQSVVLLLLMMKWMQMWMLIVVF